MVSTVMLTPVCLPQASACCLKNGSAVGMKWFHCRSDTVAPDILAGACAAGFAASVGLAAAAGAVVAAAGAVVAAAGPVVGFAAGASVGLAAGGAVAAGWL